MHKSLTKPTVHAHTKPTKLPASIHLSLLCHMSGLLCSHLHYSLSPKYFSRLSAPTTFGDIAWQCDFLSSVHEMFLIHDQFSIHMEEKNKNRKLHANILNLKRDKK